MLCIQTPTFLKELLSEGCRRMQQKIAPRAETDTVKARQDKLFAARAYNALKPVTAAIAAAGARERELAYPREPGGAAISGLAGCAVKGDRMPGLQLAGTITIWPCAKRCAKR